MRMQTRQGLLISFMLVGLSCATATGQPAQDHLPLTPPMGWSSWAGYYDCIYHRIDEPAVTSIVQVIKDQGYDKLGWRYICLDDAMFAADRGPDGQMRLDPVQFPKGLNWLMDFIHSRGLKFGAYLTAGTASNCGSVGSMGHWYEDGKFIADVGFDFVKLSFDSGPLDWGPQGTIYDGYREIIRGIRASTNQVFINASTHEFLPWMPFELNSWHSAGGQGDANGYFDNFLRRLDFTVQSAWAVRPGHFMDADFIKQPVSVDELKAEFGMHCLIQGQLLVGVFTGSWREVISNVDAIAINQDPLVIPASKVAPDSIPPAEVWAKPFRVRDGSCWAFGFLNRGTGVTATMTLNFTNLPLAGKVGIVRDVWNQTTAGIYTNSFSAQIPAASLGLYILSAAPAENELKISRAAPGEALLSWQPASNRFLQTATNLAGPWDDLAGARGLSLTNFPTSDSVRFFRLGQPK